MQHQGPEFGNPKQAPILIAYRQDGNGKGAFYDHYTLQNHTQHQTCVAKHPELPSSALKTYAGSQTHALTFGDVDPQISKKLPPNAIYNTQGGLLVIPGVTRDDHDHPDTDHQKRMKFEKALIQDAMNRGRPVLGICGGSWQIYDWAGGCFVAVKDHAYARMPNIGTNGDVVYNIQVHGVKIEKDSLVAIAMEGKRPDSDIHLNVNSVHWKACDDKAVPINFKISAKSATAPDIQLKNRAGAQMKPQTDTIEAFETDQGAPVIGIQWHPEAYGFSGAKLKALDSAKHKSLLLFMAKAGDAFAAKQTMLEEFKGTHGVEDIEEEDICKRLDQLKIK